MKIQLDITKKSTIIVFVILVVGALAFVGIKNKDRLSGLFKKTTNNNPTSLSNDLTTTEIDNISKSIVSLRCYDQPTDVGPYENVIFGSGVFLNTSLLGLPIQKEAVVSNSHVAPVKQNGLYNFCNIFFLEDGQNYTRDAFHSNHRYLATYDKKNSALDDRTGIDFAILDGFPETSTEDTNYKLTPEKKTYLDTALLNKNLSGVKLCGDVVIGSKVYVFGYPGSAFQGSDLTSTGLFDQKNNLIISDGLISGKNFDGNYFTTAKIDAGNSGGLAVVKNNGSLCLAGIPTWVSRGEFDSLGVIQPFSEIIKKINVQ